MRIGVAVLLAIVVAACSGGGWEETLDDALARQPAELVVAPDDFLFDPDLSVSCSGDLVSRMMAIDTKSGERLWDRQIPFTNEPPIALGDRVLAIGSEVHELPPGVIALDLRTGEPEWQRFLAERYLVGGGVDGTQVVVHGQAATYVLGRDGTVLAEEPLWSSSDRSPADSEWEATFDGARVVVEGPDGSRVESEPIDVPSDDFATVVSVEKAGDRFLVRLGSDLGPNTHPVVFDATGAVVWSTNSVRHAHLVGDLVVYDLRNQTMSGEGPTREVIAASLDDGGARWQTQAFAEHIRGLPGFVGGVDGGAVFAQQSPGSLPTLVLVADQDDAPMPIHPARAITLPRHRVVDDDVVALASDDGLAMWIRDVGSVFEPTTLPVRSVILDEGTLVAVTGSELVGCG